MRWESRTRRKLRASGNRPRWTSRGRECNTAYVALDQPDDSHAAPEPDEVTARKVLYGVLQHSGVELSARQTIRTEQDAWGSIAQLAAEYETIAAAAQRDRWVELLDRSGLTREQVDDLVQSDSFGPLTAELRRAEANHYDLDLVLPSVVRRRGFGDAVDIGAVLMSRISHETGRVRRGKRSAEPNLIAGLIPAAGGPMASDMADALRERAHLIEDRARALVESAVEPEPMAQRLGSAPDDEAERQRWQREVATVAAYRDRYGIAARTVLGEDPATEAQRHDAGGAEQAIRRARAIARLRPPSSTIPGECSVPALRSLRSTGRRWSWLSTASTCGPA